MGRFQSPRLISSSMLLKATAKSLTTLTVLACLSANVEQTPARKQCVFVWINHMFQSKHFCCGIFGENIFQHIMRINPNLAVLPQREDICTILSCVSSSFGSSAPHRHQYLHHRDFILKKELNWFAGNCLFSGSFQQSACYISKLNLL